MKKSKDFYVLVDTEQKIVIDKIQKLPENWCNIAGLSGLEDEKLKNLKWAGQDHKGWINLKSPEIVNYSTSPENLELNKNTFKYLISNIRKEKQSETIEYKGAKLKSNTNTLYSLSLLRTKEKVNFKCINGYFTFISFEINELYDIMESHIQKWFDWEMNIYSQIDKCENLCDFLNINYDF
jgi:hypothetical protein